MKAQIIELPSHGTGYRYEVAIIEGGKCIERRLMPAGSPGAPPHDVQVGDVGDLVYRSGPTYGLYFWETGKS